VGEVGDDADVGLVGDLEHELAQLDDLTGVEANSLGASPSRVAVVLLPPLDGGGVGLEDLVEHTLVGRVVRVARIRLTEEGQLVGGLLLPVDEEAASGGVAAVEPQQVALSLRALALPVREELAGGVVGAEHIPTGADDVGGSGLDGVEQLLELLAQHLGLGLAARGGAGGDGVQVGATVGIELERSGQAVEDRLAGAQVAATLDEVVVGDGDLRELGDLGAAQPDAATALGALDPDLLRSDRVPSGAEELAEG
jgi:hypothetical protein